MRKKVEEAYKKFFKESPGRVQKEDVVKFIRFFGSEGEVKSEPVPNSIEDVMHLLRGRT